jgi:hypothetical protein
MEPENSEGTKYPHNRNKTTRLIIFTLSQRIQHLMLKE